MGIDSIESLGIGSEEELCGGHTTLAGAKRHTQRRRQTRAVPTNVNIIKFVSQKERERERGNEKMKRKKETKKEKQKKEKYHRN